MDHRAHGDDELLRWTAQGVGRLVLNRPRAINALSHAMVRGVLDALTAWADDPDVRSVVVTGAGERGFCAGGDVRSMAEAARAGAHGRALAFLLDEYRMNGLIGSWPKPIVAILDGVTMGGGIGVGGHASIRVVTERSVLAMPEARIGFAPDVGGTHLLSRMPGRLGIHLAMTASSMTGADAIATGFADFFVPSQALPDLLAELESGGEPVDTVQRFAVAASPSELLKERAWVDENYVGDDALSILARLERHPDERAQAAGRVIRELSPTAVAVSLQAVRRAGTLPDLRTALEQEWRTANGMLRTSDFVEGVRAQLIDKDRSPTWSPARLEEVDRAAVQTILDTEPDERLWVRRTDDV